MILPAYLHVSSFALNGRKGMWKWQRDVITFLLYVLVRGLLEKQSCFQYNGKYQKEYKIFYKSREKIVEEYCETREPDY